MKQMAPQPGRALRCVSARLQHTPTLYSATQGLYHSWHRAGALRLLDFHRTSSWSISRATAPFRVTKNNSLLSSFLTAWYQRQNGLPRNLMMSPYPYQVNRYYISDSQSLMTPRLHYRWDPNRESTVSSQPILSQNDAEATLQTKFRNRDSVRLITNDSLSKMT